MYDGHSCPSSFGGQRCDIDGHGCPSYVSPPSPESGHDEHHDGKDFKPSDHHQEGEIQLCPPAEMAVIPSGTDGPQTRLFRLAATPDALSISLCWSDLFAQVSPGSRQITAIQLITKIASISAK